MTDYAVKVRTDNDVMVIYSHLILLTWAIAQEKGHENDGDSCFAKQNMNGNQDIFGHHSLFPMQYLDKSSYKKQTLLICEVNCTLKRKKLRKQT